MKDRIENDFRYHAPSPEKVMKHEIVRNKCKELALFILENCPPGRERALAITKIEEAMMWANAAVARN